MLEQKVCIASDISVFREILESGTDILVESREINEWKNNPYRNKSRLRKRRRVWDEKQWTWLPLLVR